MTNSITSHSNKSPKSPATVKIDRALIAVAQREYAATVSAAMAHTAPDARRVLTSEHCALKSAIDAYRRDGDSSNLEAVVLECARVRRMWT